MTENGEWHVLVEETAGFGRDAYRWTLTKAARCADRDDARKRAFALAKEYEPEHPMKPRGRRVFQVGNDTWVVEVPGATTDFHFRVSAALLIHQAGNAPDNYGAVL